MVDKEKIKSLRRQGWKNADIAAECGCSRQTVQTVLKEAGMSRRHSIKVPSVIGIEVSAQHKRQYAFQMFKIMEALREGHEVPDKSREGLESFLENLEDKTWTYAPEEGFFWVARKTEHEGRPFVAGLQKT